MACRCNGVEQQLRITLQKHPNKRLHVELCLMQIASLHFTGEKKEAIRPPFSSTKENKQYSAQPTVQSRRVQKDYKQPPQEKAARRRNTDC